MRNFLCIGHRGAAGLEPENTLRSIRKALDLGVDGIEIDVYFVEDQLVVIHDDTLERTTNGRGHVGEQTFDYLRSLDAGRGEQIPTLEEVLDLVDRRAFVNIELKGPHTAAPVAGLIAAYIKTHGWRHPDFLISSFDHAELSRLAGSDIRLAPLFGKLPRNYLEIAKSLGAYSINIASRVCTETVVQQIHASNLKTFVYTVNTQGQIQKMRALGIDGIFTDFPDRVVS